MNAAEGSWRELVEKKRCLQSLCGDLECKVGWKFSGRHVMESSAEKVSKMNVVLELNIYVES